MRVLKWLLTAAVAVGLGSMWVSRAQVVDAYRSDEPTELAFTLDGLDLSVEPQPIAPSPYLIPRAPDTSRQALNIGFAAPPRSPASTALGGGTATLTGNVLSAEGPVGDAIVRIERHTLDGWSAVDVLAELDGSWEATGLAGGRFRVRAFVPGLYATAEAAVLFLDAGTSQLVETPVVAASGAVAVHLIGPPEVVVGSEAAVAVALTVDSVDPDGRLLSVPAGSSQMVATVQGAIALLSADEVATDPDGVGRFRIRCDSLGSGMVLVSLPDGSRSVLVATTCVTALTPVASPQDDDANGDSADG